jgi:hypothetical protein
MTTTSEGKLFGRPSKYDPAFCHDIISLMGEGLSLTDTAYQWEKDHPDFSDAIKIARGKRLLFLERRLLGAAEGPVVTSSIFALKNADRLEWRDKQDIEHTTKDGEAMGTTHELGAALAFALRKAAESKPQED